MSHPAPLPPAEYAKAARSIRARYASLPAERHARLQALARAQSRPQAPPPATPRSAVRPGVVVRQVAPVAPAGSRGPAPALLAIPPDVAAAFSAEVAGALTAGILRYTARRRLLARAGRLGIRPFEANLLIASVLHAHRPLLPTEQPSLVRRVLRAIGLR